MQKVVLTGGGTAGHVMPNVAILPLLQELGVKIHYIGSSGIELKIIADQQGVKFHKIRAGKLRRYFSFQNFFDVFNVLVGFFQSLFLMFRIRPCAVFSKGGFVTVPVVFAARIFKIPIILHESDISPGLANRICIPFAHQVLCAFETTKKFINKDKVEAVGLPVRTELFDGDRTIGAKLCGFDEKSSDPVLLVMGGSLGAQRINDTLKDSLPCLLKYFCVVHLTGKGKSIEFSDPRYKAFEFVGDELKHLLKLADLVVGRAGATSIFEFLGANKPMLLIPLSSGRGDQIENAAEFVDRGWAMVLHEKQMTPKSLQDSILILKDRAEELKKAQEAHNGLGSIELVVSKIQPYLKCKP